LREILDKCYIRSPVDGKKRLMKLVKGQSVRSDGFAFPPNLEIWVGRRIVLRDKTPYVGSSIRRLLRGSALAVLEDDRWKSVLEQVLSVKFKHLIRVIYLKPEGYEAYAEELRLAENLAKMGPIKTGAGECVYSYYGLVVLVRDGSAFMRMAFNKLKEVFGWGKTGKNGKSWSSRCYSSLRS